MGFDVGYATAFAAGLASFVSPCVLPLVPAYLSFLAGVSYDDVVAAKVGDAVGRRVLGAALAFVAGFVCVFVALGASATLLGSLLLDHADVLEKISGALIVLFGLNFMGLIRVPFLQRDARFHPKKLPAGPLGAFLMGFAFAFGWTPCVGPILGVILTLAAQSASLGHGVLLLAVYGAGLGAPFLIAAVALGPLMRGLVKIRSYFRAIEISIGALMVVTGAFIISGSLASVSGWLLRMFPALGRFG